MLDITVPFLDLSALHAEVQDQLDGAWREVTRSAKFVGGEHVAAFEAEWAAYCDSLYCVGLANGTAALELTLRAMGIGDGAEVIVPANTFVATAAAVVVAGARPVFIDVDPATLLMTAAGIEAAFTPGTEAVIIVHLFGQPADMDAINRVAAAADIAVIEDAAQAHGATWNGRRAGGLGHAGCFSFYPGKNLGALGDAGAIVTNDRCLAERVRSLSNHGRPADAPHIHDMIGVNERLDALQAALLSVKLKRLDAWNEARSRAAERYRTLLRELPLAFVEIAEGASSSHHLMVIQTPDRDRVRGRLAALGIGTGIHYPIPCHRQQAFASDRMLSFPIVERAAGSILSLPMYPHLSDVQISRVAEALEEATTLLPLTCEATK